MEQQIKKFLTGQNSQKDAPNIGYFALATLNELRVLHTVITQNIYALHQDSGIPPASLMPLYAKQGGAFLVIVNLSEPRVTAPAML